MNTFDVIDAHHHLWSLANGYPWLEGPGDAQRFYGDDARMRVQNYLVEDIRADAQNAGLRLIGSVHVEAAPGDALGEVDWLAEQRARTGLPSVAVGAVDLRNENADEVLDAFAAREIVRGVREIIAWHPDPHASFADRPDVMEDRAWRSRYASLSRRGLSFDLQVYPNQLGMALRLAQENPDVPLALVHTASPHFTAPDDRALWSQGLRGLAAAEHTVLKVSGLGMFFHDERSLSTAEDVVREAVDIFGPDRIMFGSNFPVDGINWSYADIYALFDRATSSFSQTERQRMFAGTAAAFYRITS